MQGPYLITGNDPPAPHLWVADDVLGQEPDGLKKLREGERRDRLAVDWAAAGGG